ncbi:MAG: superoxide dismutase, Ni [Actinobacteria bacterium]|jgi:nickel superoxide dismutase|nr:superoxide dismutase, Ni [Actinomycetota bacterium]|tara:strand:+ start:634 stop:1050 length:417 start_codon:yes stop_codon:yes gene_type:complete
MLNLLRIINYLKSSDTVLAHCDIPCGIYDPHDAIEAAQTCIRMTELILEKKDSDDTNSITRYIVAKEDHAKKAKDDLLIIWTDYFKPEHLEKYPDLHEKVWSACKLGSSVKQGVDMKVAQDFKAAIEEIGNIFWETKK